MRERDVAAQVAGDRLLLLGERAAYWGTTRTLLVADPHFGKAASFRTAGVPVPRGTTAETLRRLDVALDRTAARRIIFLGDFLHARSGRSPETLQAVNDWRDLHGAIDMVLVRGNHDKRAGDPPRELAIRCVDGPLIEGPFVFSHHPVSADAGYVICGHVHPGARLSGRGRQRARLPCFWLGAKVAVLPAFGEFTGLADIDPAPGDRVWVVAEGEVVPVHTAILDDLRTHR
jgi:DNA ligase-associated metallophosphoesterase